jgi:hypothetical protein
LKEKYFKTTVGVQSDRYNAVMKIQKVKADSTTTFSTYLDKAGSQ